LDEENNIMTNSAFDLASIAQQGEAADKLPPRSRRKSQNPFAAIVQRVAEEKLTWKYPAVSTVEVNGETSVADQVESGIRQAGNALDRTDKESGGPGWKTSIRKVASADGTEVTISFTVERRGEVSDARAVPSEDTDTGEAPARRSRRAQ
jgi:hypothetical protein